MVWQCKLVSGQGLKNGDQRRHMGLMAWERLYFTIVHYYWFLFNPTTYLGLTKVWQDPQGKPLQAISHEKVTVGNKVCPIQ